jgi:hypothetical protein
VTWVRLGDGLQVADTSLCLKPINPKGVGIGAAPRWFVSAVNALYWIRRTPQRVSRKFSLTIENKGLKNIF